MNATETVNNFLEAFASGGDPSVYLTDDFSFKGPMLQANSKVEFLQGMAAMGPMKPKFEVLRQFADGDDVCTIYNFVVGENKILMSEWSTVRGEKICSQQLVFDTEAFKAAAGG